MGHDDEEINRFISIWIVSSFASYESSCSMHWDSGYAIIFWVIFIITYHWPVNI